VEAHNVETTISIGIPLVNGPTSINGGTNQKLPKTSPQLRKPNPIPPGTGIGTTRAQKLRN